VVGSSTVATAGTLAIGNPEAMGSAAEFDLFMLFGNLGSLNPFALYFGSRTPATTATQPTTSTRR
jgi:hypothetical protein